MLHERARVVMTSATDRQVKLVLWKELRRIYDKAPCPLGGTLHLAPDSGLQFANGNEIVGYTAKHPEKMAGTSSPNLLYLVDEASGVPEEIFEAIEGNRMGGVARIVMFSNPTQNSGTFFEAFHAKREFWHTIHVSGEEAAEYGDAIPGLASHESIDEKRREWGENSPLYQVRIAGNFSISGDQMVISLGAITAAIERWFDTVPTGPLDIGVDVARFGDDDTVIQPVRGERALRSRVLHGADNVEVAEAALEVARLHHTKREKPRIRVDGCGNGSGVVDVLRRFENEIEVYDLNAATKATARGFVRLRDELWFGLADWLRTGGIPADTKLEAELAAPLYEFDVQGRQVVESKDEMKKRLGRSPDRADALALAVYQGRGLASSPVHAAVVGEPRDVRQSDAALDHAIRGVVSERRFGSRHGW